MSTRDLTIREAIREGIREEMAADERVFLMGENVAGAGGIFKLTEGLLAEFGPERVIDTPISEEGFVGMAVGAALTGMRPIVEVMFIDFITLAMDPIINQAAHIRYMTGGQAKVPLTIRTTLGAGRSSAGQHSQSLHAWFCHVPGLKVVLPSTPYDAKGLIKSAIRDDNPVMFIEDKMMYDFKGPVPQEAYSLPLGVADIKREGEDLTIIATSSMVQEALKAADQLSMEGIHAEIIDPRTLLPLDKETLVKSAIKTGRVIVVDEGYRSYGVTSELAMTILEQAFYYLICPIVRIGALDVPVPFSKPLEDATIPSASQIIAAAKKMVDEKA
jgi:acetoin:2,6-dichlorophenolindophenol oxidoreductase subunit beta